LILWLAVSPSRDGAAQGVPIRNGPLLNLAGTLAKIGADVTGDSTTAHVELPVNSCSAGWCLPVLTEPAELCLALIGEDGGVKPCNTAIVRT
jgi:hypothetical protein